MPKPTVLRPTSPLTPFGILAICRLALRPRPSMPRSRAFWTRRTRSRHCTSASLCFCFCLLAIDVSDQRLHSPVRGIRRERLHHEGRAGWPRPRRSIASAQTGSQERVRCVHWRCQMVRLLNIQRRELRASGRLLAPAPPKPLVAQADVPHELVGTTFTYVSRDGVSQTCSIHRSGHDADG
jgi:hypothetical protein